MKQNAFVKWDLLRCNNKGVIVRSILHHFAHNDDLCCAKAQVERVEQAQMAEQVARSDEA